MWADYDRDGDLDAYIGDRGLYRNDGGTFVLANSSVGIGTTPGIGAWADFDGDGRLDLLTTTIGTTILYQSTFASSPCRETNGAITLRVMTDRDGNATDATTSDDRDALGARVTIDLDGDGDFVSGGYGGADRTVTYLVGMAQSANRAQSQLPLIVGIGAAASVDVRVRFVDGSTVTLTDVARSSTTVVRDVP
jgi:hypothetical protein